MPAQAWQPPHSRRAVSAKIDRFTSPATRRILGRTKLKMMKISRQNTQWTAQFAVAAELCKRGCEVSFTMGNCTPLADLMVLWPGGRMFLVDVKGQSTRNFWRIKAKDERSDLFYVLCYVGDPSSNRFFPLSQSNLHELMDRYRTSGIKYDERFAGFNWGDALGYENDWDQLPLT